MGGVRRLLVLLQSAREPVQDDRHDGEIGLDLYISLALSVVFIYLHTGSGLVAAAWLVPVLVYANQAVLLYVVINFEQIVARLA